MSADWAVATAAIVSAVVAILAVIVTVILHSSNQSDRKLWELDQDKKRNSSQKDLQDRQNAWQVGRDKEQKEWQANLQKPNLQVEIDLGILAFDAPHSGSLDIINIRAKNVGMVRVYLAALDVIVLPNSRKVIPPSQGMRKYLHENPLQILEPGDSTSGMWFTEYLVQALQQEYVGVEAIDISALYSDKLGHQFYSSLLSLRLVDRESSPSD